MRTIRFRLGLLVFGCLLIAFAGAGGVIYALRVTDRTIDHALNAQRRLDLITEMSGRIQQYGLLAISSADDPTLRATRLKEAEQAVYSSITAFEPEIARAIAEADLPLNVNAMAARAKPLEQVRAGFRILVRQVDQSTAQQDPIARTDTIKGAFNAFATMTGPYLFFLMQADRRGVEAGRETARATSQTLTDAAVIFVGIALVVAFFMYRTLSQPILAAVTEIRDAAIAIGDGKRDLKLPVRRRDELGLLAAVFNRMTARLRRGEQKVTADQVALETTIADRTADLRAVNDKLSEIDRSRRRFFADVSHELRTPLTVILGECEIALASAPPIGDTEKAAEALTRDSSAFAVIRRRAERLRRRIEDMLRVARSESGTIELHFSRIALQAVCASAIEAFEGATKRKDVQIRLEAPEAEIAIDGDFEWLRQIIEGMIDNALRYAKGTDVIALHCATSADKAFLSVRDNGPGFGVENPNDLMVRFARKGTIEDVSGHGIGLSLVRWVVDKHRGMVTLKSAKAPLHGAEILIELPLAGTNV